MKPLARRALVLLVAAGIGWYLAPRDPSLPAGAPPDDAQPWSAAAPAELAADEARAAFADRAGGRMVRTRGTVSRTLADDRDGSPHQRFIISTDSGVSLLIAHNIALAPRLDGLSVGDRIEVYGEYEWNDKGGLLHWTHHDPQGRHVAGYIEWRGRRYQ